MNAVSPAIDVSTRRAQMFPRLSAAQIARVARFGQERAVSAGELLFEEGDRAVPMHVILEGEIEVVHPRGAVEEPIAIQGPGEFTGEVSQLADRPSLVRARAKTRCRVLVVARPVLKTLVQTDPELSEVFLRAFILRRMASSPAISETPWCWGLVTLRRRCACRSFSRATATPTVMSTSR